MIKPFNNKDGSRPKRLSRVVSLLLVSSLVAAACGGSSTDETDASGETEGDAAAGSSSDFPQLTAATLDGGQIEFSSLEGEDTMLWFWAPW